MNKNIAFTLAELLITLGIIGVVAALTMPSLIVKHRKQVVVEKLKKTSSALLQAYNMSKLDYGDTEREGFTPLNGDAALEMFNKYYVPYMKFTKVEKGEKGAYGYLTDGTVLYFFKDRLNDTNCRSWACTYIAVCMNEKACRNVDKSPSYSGNGKDVFGLYTTGQIPAYTFIEENRARRIQRCKNNSSIEACSALIFEAGWKIPDDYPIKF